MLYLFELWVVNSEYEEWTSEGIFVSLSDGFTILIECESIRPGISQIYAIYRIEAVNCFRFTERNFWPGNLKIEWPAASPPTGGWWHHTSHNTQCVMYSFYCVFETLSTNETVSNHFGEVKVNIKGVIELFYPHLAWNFSNHLHLAPGKIGKVRSALLYYEEHNFNCDR